MQRLTLPDLSSRSETVVAPSGAVIVEQDQRYNTCNTMGSVVDLGSLLLTVVVGDASKACSLRVHQDGAILTLLLYHLVVGRSRSPTALGKSRLGRGQTESVLLFVLCRVDAE